MGFMKSSSRMAMVLAGAVWVQAQAASAVPSVGLAAPAFVGQDLKGRLFDLSSLKGHVVVVNLWATWCTPCRAEMPMLEAFYKAHKVSGVMIVGLSADRHRDIGDVRRVMQAFSYPAALLADAKTNGFGSPSVLPQTYVLDDRGFVRIVFDNSKGPLTQEQLTAAIEAASAASDHAKS
jgi:cytochrome c biogenesis protein CcmG/thiol:disulfide interchange protein DsbE